MKPSAWFYLLRRELLSQPGRAVVLVLAVGVSCGLAGMALGVLAWLREEVRPELKRLFPEVRLIADPGSLDVVFVRLQGGITEQTLEKARQLDGIKAVYPQMNNRFPVTGEITISTLGTGFSTEALLLGVERELIAEDLPPDLSWEWTPESGRPVPVAAPTYFLDMYNLGLAESNRLPKLTPAAAIGREFDLVLGESALGLGSSRQKPETVRGRVVALVENPELLGMLVPLEAIRDWNQKFGPGGSDRYSRLHIDATNAEDVPALREQLAALGLNVEAPAADLERLQRLVASVEVFLLGVIALILALTAVGVVSTVALSIRERRAAWGLARATGMRPGQILLLLAGEGLILSVLSAVLGMGIVALALRAGKAAFGDLLAQVSFVPGDPFALRELALAGVAGLAGALVLLPLLTFALPSMRREPVFLLSRRSL